MALFWTSKIREFPGPNYPLRAGGLFIYIEHGNHENQGYQKFAFF